MGGGMLDNYVYGADVSKHTMNKCTLSIGATLDILYILYILHSRCKAFSTSSLTPAGHIVCV